MPASLMISTGTKCAGNPTGYGRGANSTVCCSASCINLNRFHEPELVVARNSVVSRNIAAGGDVLIVMPAGVGGIGTSAGDFHA